MIDLGSFLAFHKSKLFLGMMGTTASLQTPRTEGDISPFWQHPAVSFGWRDGAEKVVTFWCLNRALFSPFVTANKGLG
jgi:hypothetical protein